MADMSSDQKDEFKLSFKPSLLSMSHPSQNMNINNMHTMNNGSANQQWMNATTNSSMHFQNHFLNQSPSSMLLPDNNKTNISMFNPLNDNNNLLNTSRRSSLPTDSEVLFHESVPIVVKTSMMESNTRQLTLKIEKLSQLTQNKHILSVTLTDESDPYFLYSLSVSESDFHQLRSDQTLLVDFAVFPKSLVMLLQQCLRSANETHPKFVAVLVYSQSSAVLLVQETNEFRHLQHIALKLVAASAASLRTYLGESLMMYKASTAKYLSMLNETSSKLEESKISLASSSEYVNSIKQKYEECLCDLKTSHSQQISALKQNHFSEIEEIRKELINNKNDIENELKLEIKTVSLKYSALKDDFDDLNSEKLTLQNRLKNETQKLAEINKLFSNNKAELNECRTENKRLDELKFKFEKQINEDLINISALEQQIKDKGEIANNNNNLLNSQREQKKTMEDQLKLYKANLEKTEKKVKECIKEINKGNNIISHLQNEIRNQRNKNKIKQQKIHQIQIENDNKNNENKRINNQYKEKEEIINKYKNESKELKNTLRACKDKLMQSQKAIESNQRVIKYLNKQLNNNQINHNIFSQNNMHQSQHTYNAISGLSNIATAVSPILSNTNHNNNNNHHNKPNISSYFPQ